MADREPFISDLRHLDAVAGTAWLVLRPQGEVPDVFTEAQSVVREALEDELVSYPAGHVSIMGFENEDEVALAAAVEAWAAATPPLTLRCRRVTGFPAPDQIAIMEIDDNSDLHAALDRIRDLSDEQRLSGLTEIPADAWTFHMSLAYCGDLSADRWSSLMRLAASTPVLQAACTATEAELVAFDGGPERLIGAYRLAGR
jgi:hypothetical protein